MLLTYRVRARNTSADSENKIHDDAVAASYGFSRGLVPGITVYAYMTAPIVERFGLRWLEGGSIDVRFDRPFYDGEEVLVRAEVDESTNPISILVSAGREDGTACATGVATLGGDDPARNCGLRVDEYPEAPLPSLDARPLASRESMIPGSALGTLKERINLSDTTVLEAIDERLPIYYGPAAVAHPFVLLRMANEILIRNYRLGPWIHAASEVINRSAARDGEEISVRGRIAERFERKGHEFVVLDLLVAADEARVVQQVRHTAIYSPRVK